VQVKSWLLSCILLVEGCTRIGFAPSPDAAASHDLSIPAEAGATDATDGSSIDDGSKTVGLNEVCGPPACAPGLVCTGVGETRFCRPACAYDAGTCPDGQACGRPVIGGVTDPNAARACITSTLAAAYQSCKSLPCGKGLGCVKGDIDPPLCYPLCVDDVGCSGSQICLAVITGGPKLCVPTCTATSDCPTPLRCIAGPYPKDVCAPTIPAALGATCGPPACGPALRCLGAANQTHYCYGVCPTGSCSGGELCVTISAIPYCMRACGFFDSTSPCTAFEACFADATIGKTHCMPGPADPSDCSSKICVSGKICVQGVCAQACDDTAHPCPTGKSCLSLSYSGSVAPWKACN
jgi:hypothetical protein